MTSQDLRGPVGPVRDRRHPARRPLHRPDPQRGPRSPVRAVPTLAAVAAGTALVAAVTHLLEVLT